MIVVTVARRPLGTGTVASNVLEHGCGPMNIDGCRIASDGSHMVHGVVGRVSVPAGDERKGASLGWGEPGRTFVPTNHAGGRWPANLILEHLPTCEHAGTRKIRGHGDGTPRTAIRRSGVHSEAGGHQTIGAVMPVTSHAGADGMETVADWRCAAGCPVPDLDAQAGFAMGGASRYFQQVGGSKP